MTDPEVQGYGSSSAAAAVDRITEIRIAGMRCIDEITLPLDELTVLIGPNGSGKSTILEALELMRLCGVPSGGLDSQLYSTGGLTAVLRHGARTLRLGLTCEGAGERIRYDLELAPVGAAGGFTILRECLLFGPRPGNDQPLRVIMRDSGGPATFFDQREASTKPIPELAPTALAIHSFGAFPPNAAITRLLRALNGIVVHVPFEVRPSWSMPRELPALRATNLLQHAPRLERFGANLANVWHRLKNDFRSGFFQAVMADVRAGLGPEIDDVGVQADAGGGQVALTLTLRNGRKVPAFSISDGMLAYLAFVALRHLPDPERSLLAFDEPELHLHPELLARVVGLFEEMAREKPVVLTTHSDRLLDMLSAPEKSVVLCDLGPDGTTRLRRPNAAALAKWLEEYRGLGTLRAEGYESSVFFDPASSDERGDDG
ncbi:MAG TPA: AAA family ATPase [Sandaracinaceae bacterium]